MILYCFLCIFYTPINTATYNSCRHYKGNHCSNGISLLQRIITYTKKCYTQQSKEAHKHQQSQNSQCNGTFLLVPVKKVPSIIISKMISIISSILLFTLLFLLFHRIPEGPDSFSKLQIFSVRICHQAGFIQLELPFFI